MTLASRRLICSALRWTVNRSADRPSYWVPNTNVFISSSGQLVIQVELSGVQSAGLVVTIEGHKLKVAGYRENPEFADSKQTLVHEIHSGPFESVLELPQEFDLAKSSSAYVNGVLRIVVPRDHTPLQPPQFSLEG